MLGSGAFGEVQQCRWNGTDVAVKRSGVDAGDAEALAREIALDAKVLAHPHPSVLPVLGACTDHPDGTVRLATRLCAKGSVRDHLMRARVKV